MKIAINNCHGGFGLSEDAIDLYIKLKGLNLFKHQNTEWNCISYFTVPYEEYYKVHKNDMTKTEWPGQSEGYGRYMDSNALCWSERDIERNDSILIQVIEQLGEKVNTKYSELKIVEIPDDVEWQIDEYDGLEWVAEKHRIWSA